MTDTDFAGWELFVAVAEAGSFAGAARSRGLSVPTVSRAIARLEQRLGATLFHRTSRRLSLSAFGVEALGQAQALVQQAEAMEERLGEAASTPSGLVRLAAPLEFGQAHIAPLLPPFMARYPGIEIALDLDDTRIDIVASGHDLVLRIGALDDSSLLARRLCTVQRFAVASAAYLEAQGHPAHPADLGRHRCLLYSNDQVAGVWQFEADDGRRAGVSVSGPLSASSGGALLPAVLGGAGIAVLPDFLVSALLRQGRLQALLPGWLIPALGLYMITPPSPLRPLRVRLLMQHLADGLKPARQ